MLEHQHVNMFTIRSIYLILFKAGFSDSINKGSYGNTFHVSAIKGVTHELSRNDVLDTVKKQPSLCDGFFDRAARCIPVSKSTTIQEIMSTITLCSTKMYTISCMCW